MSDLIERLRCYCFDHSDDDITLDAAEEIERLRAELFCAKEDIKKWMALNAANEKLAALKAQPAQSEPVAWMWQHDETGRTGFVDPWQVENGWQELNPRLKLIRPLYTTPQPSAEDASVERSWQRFNLENIRLFAARHRKEEWAKTILRFCTEAGVVGGVTRNDFSDAHGPDWTDRDGEYLK